MLARIPAAGCWGVGDLWVLSHVPLSGCWRSPGHGSGEAGGSRSPPVDLLRGSESAHGIQRGRGHPWVLRAPRCSQQDAQEFLKFFMDRLHAEINRKGRRTPSILADTRRAPAPEDADTLR